jgi:hypothetical protein
MYFVVLQCDVVFVDGIPLLKSNFIWSCANLCCYEFLKVSYGIVFIAFYPDLVLCLYIYNKRRSGDGVRTGRNESRGCDGSVCFASADVYIDGMAYLLAKTIIN